MYSSRVFYLGLVQKLLKTATVPETIIALRSLEAMLIELPTRGQEGCRNILKHPLKQLSKMKTHTPSSFLALYIGKYIFNLPINDYVEQHIPEKYLNQ